jgi:hypothetical protein
VRKKPSKRVRFAGESVTRGERAALARGDERSGDEGVRSRAMPAIAPTMAPSLSSSPAEPSLPTLLVSLSGLLLALIPVPSLGGIIRVQSDTRFLYNARLAYWGIVEGISLEHVIP